MYKRQAYYLQQMGHQCTIFEQRKELGGMLYYGIPNYRLPKDRLAEDIQNILATGVETKMNTCIGDGDGEISFKMLKENYDAVYVSIGAQDVYKRQAAASSFCASIVSPS